FFLIGELSKFESAVGVRIGRWHRFRLKNSTCDSLRSDKDIWRRRLALTDCITNGLPTRNLFLGEMGKQRTTICIVCGVPAQAFRSSLCPRRSWIGSGVLGWWRG